MIKIGAKVVRHGHYVTFQLAEVAVSRALLAQGPGIDRKPASATAKTGMTKRIGINEAIQQARCVQPR